MTHHLFTHGPKLRPGTPPRDGTAGRTRAVLGTAGICLCLALAAAADTSEPAGTGAAAARRAVPAGSASHAIRAHDGWLARRAEQAQVTGRSVGRAYEFLTLMLNLHNPAGGGSPADLPTLPQSYLGGLLGRQHYTVSSIYDDALVIDAYLATHTGWDAVRAERVGNALVYLQRHGRGPAGQLFDGYAPGTQGNRSGMPVANRARNTGDLAWAGLALAELYDATGNTQYLDSAVGIGRWIQANCASDRGAGGYTGGYADSGERITWKSTEHNIDVFALFRLLARLTGQHVWLDRAQHARRFIAAMWDRPPGVFDIGTIGNGVTVNDSVQAEDVNSWSYLALRDPAYVASVSWEMRNLANSTGRFHGISLSTCDRSGVWYEGTAHLADALQTLGTAGDRRRAAGYLADIRYAQAHGPDADGLGIVASSDNDLTDCQGNFVYSSLHTGTTAWYILAAKAIDPLSAVPLVDQPVR
jgi:hypothetical protein